jgi:cytochrome c oxidase cbb3-type subunit 4
MNYDMIRHLADSWGLVFMALLFVSFVGWTFRKGASQRHKDAANMIFRDDDNGQEVR